ncbi:uncharacterized protein (TIGR00645 family) [Methylohalomonas lacus]|uniref:UPF0114 protein J2T55_000873 n=1 Tax=Methylohalomonas lacus TaxID=398773 RepID=A0AAE3HIC0_9GAMM|nr:uncharacterized protein (TIGR00645 family) [Methylohalomonas lacus]
MLEQRFEKLLFAMRWLLAPIYFGLSLALLALAIKFFQELVHLFPHILETAETDLILTVLALVDIALVGSLIIMVMLSGYENFVSRIDVDTATEKLGWMGKLDAGTLKIKVAASIVAISSIHLLQAFMDVQKIPNDKLMWYVIIHMTFVFSALLLGWLDKIAFSSHRDH